jgi:hypothetical protein
MIAYQQQTDLASLREQAHFAMKITGEYTAIPT